MAGTQASVVQMDTAVEAFEIRKGQASPKAAPFRSFGTLWSGYNTPLEAWKGLTHLWSAGSPRDPATPDDVAHYPGTRFKTNLLQRNPVDILVVERGIIGHTPTASESLGKVWMDLVKGVDPDTRPSVIIEAWQGKAALWEFGPASTALASAWGKVGYASRHRVVTAVNVGGAVTQTRLMVVRHKKGTMPSFRWPDLHPDVSPRPMGNVLTPVYLLPWATFHKRLPDPMDIYHDPKTDPMPWHNWEGELPWVTTDRGYRRLTWDEVARALGVAKISVKDRSVPPRQVLATTSVFHWEYIGRTILGEMDVAPSPHAVSLLPSDAAGLQLRAWEEQATLGVPDEPEPFAWTPPDLTPGGIWHTARLASLRTAADATPQNREELFASGVQCLADHRLNYDSTGAVPTRPRILWWEFPQEHWEPLREGSSMYFLKEPSRVIHPNSPMDDDARAKAAEFLDELIDLGIARRADPENPVWATIPIFTLVKPYQPGQIRIIADALAGGQNECCARDPVYLNRPGHILEQLYEGGYTAVVDASKFFYQFLTRKEDQRYLGIVHPRDETLWYYGGLPMGAGPSPGHAGRYGLAFLRILRERHELFRGKPLANCWWTSLNGGQFRPELGYGYVWILSDGTGAVRLFVHVDDFFICGPTKEVTDRALALFLDTAVDVGLLCHPKKVQPPSQLQKYVGFIFDTRGIPTLRVPTGKREKALAMVEFLAHSPANRLYTRMALAVVAGTLESLSEATPARLGHTYLRSLYDAIHPEGAEIGERLYHTKTALPPQVHSDLCWWSTLLRHDVSRRVRSRRSGVLVPTFGDGSGTGTGGTLLLPTQGFAMWMGQWTPYIFPRSSNWKELKTLLLTLQAARDLYPADVRGTTLFYFTDNSTTYWIAASGSSRSPGLHALIQDIRLLELELDCHLQVVHVPGVVMIDQGTDGLSRGVWMSELHPHVDQDRLTAAVFDPAHEDMTLIHRCAEDIGLGEHQWSMSPWKHPIAGADLLHRFTAHFPPPELARQTIVRFLEAWVESPLDTGAIFVVPRIVASFWHGLSRHVVEWAELRVENLRLPPLLPIPVVVLYTLPHVRILPSPSSGRLDPHIPPSLRRRTQREADDMRGLPPASLSKRPRTQM